MSGIPTEESAKRRYKRIPPSMKKRIERTRLADRICEDDSVDKLGLGKAINNSLFKHGIVTIKDLLKQIENPALFSVYDGIAITTSTKIRERLSEAGFINESHPFSHYYMDMSERWYSASEYLKQMSFDEKMRQDIESLNLKGRYIKALKKNDIYKIEELVKLTSKGEEMFNLIDLGMQGVEACLERLASIDVINNDNAALRAYNVASIDMERKRLLELAGRINTFSGRLRLIRLIYNETQAQMASNVCVSEQMIRDYEKDRKKPSYDTFNRIAKTYKENPDFLLGKSDEAWIGRYRKKRRTEIAKMLKNIEKMDKDGLMELFDKLEIRILR